MEYEEFVEAFRARTAARRAEFEKALAEAEKKAKQAERENRASGAHRMRRRPGPVTSILRRE